MPELKYTFAWPAQVYQESHCKLDARSPAGAMGPAQIMPGTWREVAEELRLPHKATPFDIVALDAGAYYQSKMLAFWTADRPLVEKVYLAQASYNAGAGNINKAQRESGGERFWRDISPFLPNVTGRHAAETQAYVSRISIAWKRMCADKPRCRPEDI